MTKHGIELCAPQPVTKHRDQCLSLAGIYWISDGASINFVEYMRYKSVCFCNSLEKTVIVDSGERNRAIQ